MSMFVLFAGCGREGLQLRPIEEDAGGMQGSDSSTGAGSVGGAGGATSPRGTTGDDPCAGQPDFTPCTVVTTPDRHYDICVEGTCVSPGCGDASCNVPGPHFPLADTDQRLCDDDSAKISCPASGGAFFGQDAQYGWDTLHAESERFTRAVANQPVVRDNVTGLDWQGCAAGLTGNACDSGSPNTYVWTDALAYCDGLDWGGWQDWRLPDPYELHSILDLGALSKPLIDTTAFPATPSSGFWTSASFPEIARYYAWQVLFYAGYLSEIDKSWESRVRCVRGGSASGTASVRFSRNTPVADQPVVTDAVTGLSWQGCAAGLTGSDCSGNKAGTYTWANALGYCAGLDWGGRQDWRLPNAKELGSIANQRPTSRLPVAETVFPNVPTDWLWSSSSCAHYPSQAFNVFVKEGCVNSYGKAGLYYVLCVRSGP